MPSDAVRGAFKPGLPRRNAAVRAACVVTPCEAPEIPDFLSFFGRLRRGFALDTRGAGL
jgi:hypothetical protein